MTDLRVRAGLALAGAILIQLCLGAIYAWAAFTPALREAGWSATAAQVPFTVGLLTFAITMVLAGRRLHDVGPRTLTLVGGLCLGLGYGLAGSFGGTAFWPTLIGVGVLGGVGIGMAYVVPLAVGMQWFPNHKGLITGVAVAGFGFGATIWVKLAGSWAGLLATYGLGTTFLVYGALFATIVALGSLTMSFPPSFEPPTAATVAAPEDFRSDEILRTPQFWTIFATFAIGATAGLMTIGLMKQVPGEALVEAGLTAADADAAAGTAMVLFAFANALGRIGWGKISDALAKVAGSDHGGRKAALLLLSATQGVFILAFPFAAGQVLPLYALAVAIGFNFGGNFALFPALTTDTFGSTYFGQNYGYVFLAYGLGGTVGPILGGYLGDTGHVVWAFALTGTMSFVAAGLMLTATVPEPHARPDTLGASPAK